MTQTLDVLSDIPCYRCIILEPTRAPPENCNPNQCQTLTDWIMKEAKKQQELNTTVTTSKTTH